MPLIREPEELLKHAWFRSRDPPEPFVPQKPVAPDGYELGNPPLIERRRASHILT